MSSRPVSLIRALKSPSSLFPRSQVLLPTQIQQSIRLNHSTSIPVNSTLVGSAATESEPESLRITKSTNTAVTNSGIKQQPPSPQSSNQFFISPELIQRLEQSQFYSNYSHNLNGHHFTINPSSASLQDFLIFASNQLISSSSNSSEIDTDIRCKRLEQLKDTESTITLLLQCILMAINPGYQNEYVDNCLNSFGKELDLIPIQLNPLRRQESVFTQQNIETIIRNPKVKLAVSLLKFKLSESLRWSIEKDCHDDLIFSWINSLFAKTINKSLYFLNGSKDKVPPIIIYDLLLRNPENELEFKALLAIYKKWHVDINPIDQEKLYYLSQFSSNNTNYINRSFVLPPAFNNLFKYALRYQIEALPELIDLYLSEVTASNSPPHLLPQLSEIIWDLSIDQTGENTTQSSRYYNMAQSRSIRAVNIIVSSNPQNQVDVPTMLGVSNLNFFNDYRKSFRLFKEARKRFDRWQLESFDLDGFERVLYSQSIGFTKNINELRSIRKDYNIRFLCNSILLLSVKPNNKESMFAYLFKVLQNMDDFVFMTYPEVWRFVLIKLNYHNILGDNNCLSLFQLYLQKANGAQLDPLVLDIFINNINKLDILLKVAETCKDDGFDDLNLAKYIAKLYKLSKTFQQKPEVNPINTTEMKSPKPPLSSDINSSTTTTTTNTNTSGFTFNDETLPHTVVSIVEDLQQSNKIQKEVQSKSQFKLLGFEGGPIELARHLYTESSFKSSKLNSSYLLGEAVVSPTTIFQLFNNLNQYTKLTPITISSLFIAALRLKELGIHDEIKWGLTEEDEASPIEFALSEFESNVCQAFGDDTYGKIYPTDNLLSIYIKSIKDFEKTDEIFNFPQRLVDLRYSINGPLFKQYLSAVPESERLELLNCLSSYHTRFEKLRACKSEFELNSVKRGLATVFAKGKFKEFVNNLEVNWDVIRSWDWPGK